MNFSTRAYATWLVYDRGGENYRSYLKFFRYSRVPLNSFLKDFDIPWHTTTYFNKQENEMKEEI